MKLKSVIFFFLSLSINAQTITIDDTKTAQELVQDVLFNNSGCAIISNFNVYGNNSYASFSRNGSIFPFSEGVVLSTGYAVNCQGPNSTLSDDNLATPIDNDLAVFFDDTFDATVLEFDFIPQANYMSFEYIFASEEYQENDNNTCAYSDVFAFLIKKSSDTTYTNIATVPNTDTPVQVTTVHPEISASCSAVNEAYFGSWNDTNYPANFNGQTAILKATSIVEPGETYHIKLVIADHSNYRYDSAVFLKAGSFNISTDLGVDILRSTNNALCGTATVLLDTGISTAISYTWMKDELPYDGVYIPLLGGNNQTYAVTSEGRYRVQIDFGGGCISEGIRTIEYGITPVVANTELIQCSDDDTNFTTFNLHDAISTITLDDSSLEVTHFYLDVNDLTSVIPNDQSYTSVTQDQIVYAAVVSPSGCTSFAEITLKVFQNPEIIADEIQTYCLDTYPEFITLDAGVMDNLNNFTYKWFKTINDVSILLPETSVSIQVNEAGSYTVEIESTDGCLVTRDILVNASEPALITEILIADTFTSDRISATVFVSGEGDYQYAIDDFDYQDSPIFGHLTYGFHVLTVRDKNGCIPNAQREITILKYAHFFTPNGDGIYDTWNLDNLNSLLLHFNIVSPITIYDRFGKVLAYIDINSDGWDGNYQNTKMLPADYWFSVDLEDSHGKLITKQGYFSLVR